MPTLGGNVVRLNSNLVQGGDVFLSIFGGVKISPDSQKVIYLANQNTLNSIEIFSVSIFGGSSHRLNGSLVVGGNVETDFQISPDSQYVVYRADQVNDDVTEIFSVNIDGDLDSLARLNEALVFGGDVSSGSIASLLDTFSISQDSQ